MRPVTFLKGALLAGEYFLGHFTWPEDMRITRATVEMNPPTGSGQARVELEVDGDLTGKTFAIGAVALVPGASRVKTRREISLNQLVPAGERLRLKVTESGDAGGDAATDATVVFYGIREAEYVATPPKLEVWWIKGHEILHLWNYNTSTHAFSEAVAGIATGRAEIVNTGPDTSAEILIEGVTALEVLASGPKLRASAFRQSLGETEVPRLEFYIDSSLAAVVTKSGVFRAGGFLEAAPGAAAGRFEFYGGGVVAAAFAADKVTADGFEATA